MNIRNSVFRIMTLCAVTLTATVSAQSTAPKITGYVKTDYSSNLKDSEAVDVSNVRLKVAGAVSEETSYVIFLDAVRDDVLLDAYVSHAILPSLTVSAGQFKTPYSTDNLLSNAKLAFINRPYLKTDAAPAFRDKGIKLTVKHGVFTADIAAMNGSGQNKDENNSNKSIATRVVGAVLPGLNLSGNYYHGINNADGEADDFINVGVNGIVGALEYSGEFAQKDHDGMIGNAMFVWVSYDIETGFAAIPLLMPALRVEQSDPDTDTDDDARSRYTASVSANFGKKFADRVMINYEICEVQTGDADDVFGIEYIVNF